MVKEELWVKYIGKDTGNPFVHSHLHKKYAFHKEKGYMAKIPHGLYVQLMKTHTDQYIGCDSPPRSEEYIAPVTTGKFKKTKTGKK